MAYGFGVVGCGMIAGFHARAIADVRGARLVACCDVREEAAKGFAAQHGCRDYTDLRAMLADTNVDIVTVTTPSGSHLEPAVAAARAGKHVIVEKPLEITLKRCDRIINECKKNKVKLGTIFQSRFHDSLIELRRAVDEKRFGRLIMGDAYVKWYRSQQYYDSGAWRGTWELDGGGALMNQAIHNVDLLTWLMGPVVEIRAHTATLAHKRIAVEDVATGSLRFANGALGVIEASTAVYPGSPKRLEIRGTEGSVVIEEDDIVEWNFAKKSRRDATILRRMQKKKSGGGGASDPAAISHETHARQFRDFVEALGKRRAPAVDGAEGRRSVEIILGLYRAAESGKPVSLPLKSDPVLQKRKKK